MADRASQCLQCADGVSQRIRVGRPASVHAATRAVRAEWARTSVTMTCWTPTHAAAFGARVRPQRAIRPRAARTASPTSSSTSSAASTARTRSRGIGNPGRPPIRLRSARGGRGSGPAGDDEMAVGGLRGGGTSWPSVSVTGPGSGDWSPLIGGRPVGGSLKRILSSWVMSRPTFASPTSSG
jgi:hypothetical protein